MKKLIFVLVFIITSLCANAQKFNMKITVPKRMAHSISYQTFDNKSLIRGISIGVSIKFSKKEGEKI